MFRKKKPETNKRETIDYHFNEGLYKTKSGEVVRFTNIDAKFESFNGTDAKSVTSHDMIRTMLIEKCYEFTLTELTETKTVFECAILTNLNHLVGDTGVKCTSFTIEQIEKVY